MADFLTATTTALGGVSAGIYTVGAVLVGVSAAIFIVNKIRAVMR